MGAAGLGLAVTALQNTYPVQKYASVIILQPINDSNDVTQPDFVEKTIKANLAIATPIGKALENKPFVEMLKKSDINQIKCSPYSSAWVKGNFDHECKLPYIPWPAMVRVAGIYEGSKFAPVMPNQSKGKYAVIFVESGQISGKPDLENVFYYKDDGFSNSIATLPFIAANDQGKHLVILNGKPTLI